MIAKVQCFVAGQWAGSESDRDILDAGHGRAVARLASGGIDAGEAWTHARTVGQKSLQQIGFAERAARLRALGRHLTEHKAALYALSTATGATRNDSWVDIDGGIGTLMAYASMGAAELPAGTIWPETQVQPLSRTGGFAGTHVRVSRTGVALHVNAFNFPVWGMLEKFAPAFLAGVPSIVKPATDTCYLTAECVRLMARIRAAARRGLAVAGRAAAGPPFRGAARAGCVLTFTGSAATAGALRADPRVLGSGAAFNVEADSLNAAILAPDVAAGSPLFDAFVEQVVREMTVKAGQKCTAIRRILVPEGTHDAVIDALGLRLAEVVVGDPALEQVQMGPLVSAAQGQDVRAAIARLAAAGRIVYRRDDEALIGDGLDTRAFVTPVLLAHEGTDPASPVHEIEAFGPVASMIRYRDLEQAAAIAAAGRGSLVSTVVGDDPRWIAGLATHLAPWHGRLHLLDATSAGETTGHGAPLPGLRHGGPGRAGGGAELGGLAALDLYMHRVAVQGSPATLMALTGQYVRGAPVNDTPEHPFRKHYEDLQVGDSLLTHRRTVSEADIVNFGCLSGDFFYMHFDEIAAAQSPFGKRIAHGYFVLSAAAGLFVSPSPGPVLANYGLDTLRFVRPVGIGDTIQARLTCKRKAPRPRKPGDAKGQGVVAWDVQVTNQEGAVVASYDILTLVEMRD
ncbi:MAG: phenylacetic acid degradation bifunctional protein PaaZ [Burkholderiaceae bacterium]